MGLGKGPRAFKRTMCVDMCGATFRAETLFAALAAEQMGLPRKTVASMRDANCASMSFGPEVRTLEEYVAAALRLIRADLRVSTLVYLGVDRPLLVPETKHDTQEDRSRRAKVDPSLPQDDAYTLERLASLANLGPMISNRETRYRAMDEIYSRALARLRVDAAEAQRRGFPMEPVVIDGIDARGASRPFGEERVPALCSTHPEAAAIFALASGVQQVGETDLLLVRAEWALRQALSQKSLSPTLDHVETLLVNTIDTDQIVLALLRDAASRSDGDGSGSGSGNGSIVTYVVLKEQGDFAKDELRKFRVATGAPELTSRYPTAGVLLVDVSALHDAFMRYLLGSQWQGQSPGMRRTVMRLLGAVTALGGCDFIKKPLGHFDALLRAYRDVIRGHGDEIARLATLGPWQHPDVARKFEDMLTRILARTGHSVCSASIEILRRALWTVAYWEVHDEGPPTDYQRWGFKPRQNVVEHERGLGRVVSVPVPVPVSVPVSVPVTVPVTVPGPVPMSVPVPNRSPPPSPRRRYKHTK